MSDNPPMDGPRQTVYLIDFPEPADPPSRLERLQAAFGVDEAMARHFLETMPVAVRRKATPEEAQGYARALEAIGAVVRISAEAPTGQMARIIDEDRAPPPSSGHQRAHGVGLPTASLPGGGPPPSRPDAPARSGEGAAPSRPGVPARSITPPSRPGVQARSGEGSPSRPGVPARAAKDGPEADRQAPFSLTPARLPASQLQEEPEHDGRSFWESIPVALTSPFVGRGLFWQLILPFVLLLAGCFLSLPCIITRLLVGGTFLFIYMGLLGQYFSGSIQQGLHGCREAAELPSLAEGWAQVRTRGAILSLLAVILFAVPGYLGWVAFVGPEKEGVRPWKVSEPFQGEQGEPLVIAVGGLPVVGKDAQGNRVRIDPRASTVELLDVAADADDQGAGLAALVFFLGLLVPLFCWPMALTIAALSGRLRDLFNPLFVFKGILKGGAMYAAVALVGALLFGGSLALMSALQLGAVLSGGGGGIGLILLAAIVPLWINAYVSGVQGHLIGRMIHDRADDFTEFNL